MIKSLRQFFTGTLLASSIAGCESPPPPRADIADRKVPAPQDIPPMPAASASAPQDETAKKAAPKAPDAKKILHDRYKREFPEKSDELIDAMAELQMHIDNIQHFMDRGATYIQSNRKDAALDESYNAVRAILEKHDLLELGLTTARQSASMSFSPAAAEIYARHGTDVSMLLANYLVYYSDVHFDAKDPQQNMFDHVADTLVEHGANIHTAPTRIIVPTKVVDGELVKMDPRRIEVPSYKDSPHTSPVLKKKCEEAYRGFEDNAAAPSDLKQLYLILAGFPLDHPNIEPFNSPAVPTGSNGTIEVAAGRRVNEEAQMRYIVSHAQWPDIDTMRNIITAYAKERKLSKTQAMELIDEGTKAIDARNPGGMSR